jgi:hypothetical protein
MLADELDYVLGVDTHRDEHVLAVVTAPAGAVIAGTAAPANVRGYRQLLRVAARHAPGRRAWAIEGTGSFGAGLARYLAERGEVVLEVSRTPPNRAAAARERRRARRGENSAGGARERETRVATRRRATRSAATAAGRAS